MKKFLQEFKEFISKGNVLDLAVGVIIGGAFSTIVTSLTEKIIQPLLNCIGGAEIGFAFQIIKGNDATTVDIGAFISAIINFLIMAFVIFIIVKAVNKASEAADKLKKKEEEAPAAPTTKVCPFCKTEIAIDAVKCPNCTSDITE